MCQQGSRFHSSPRVDRIAGALVKHRFERKCQKCISGQKCVRLSKFDMTGRPAAPHIIIVHTGQIVVDERICVNHLHGAGKGKRRARIFAARLAKGECQDRTNPLPTVFQAICHCLKQDILSLPLFWQVEMQAVFDHRKVFLLLLFKIQHVYPPYAPILIIP